MDAGLTLFVESRMPMLEHAMKVWQRDGSPKKGHAKPVAKREKYAFKQAFFYGAMYYGGRIFASKNALREAHVLGVAGPLWDLTWEEQPRFDPERRKLHLEHVFTGTMCWDAVIAMHSRGELTAKNVERLLREHYAVAWITKAENSELPRTRRGTTLRDALAVYLNLETPVVLFDRSGEKVTLSHF